MTVSQSANTVEGKDDIATSPDTSWANVIACLELGKYSFENIDVSKSIIIIIRWNMRLGFNFLKNIASKIVCDQGSCYKLAKNYHPGECIAEQEFY